MGISGIFAMNLYKIALILTLFAAKSVEVVIKCEPSKLVLANVNLSPSTTDL